MKRSLLFSFFVLVQIATNAQADCATCFAQNFVSLDADGKAQLTPDKIVAVDTTGCDLKISILDEFGEVIIPFVESAKLSCLMLGANIVQIRNDNTGSFCWGTLIVEDPLGACTSSISDFKSINSYYHSGYLFLKNKSLNSDIRIYNSAGQLLHSLKMHSSLLQLNLHFLEPGQIYFVRIFDKTGLETFSILSK